MPKRKPGRPATSAGDRDRPEVLDAVIGHQDRGRVAADGHERAVSERDLARVAREHVEPEKRDHVDADVGGLLLAEVAEEGGSDEHRDGEDDEGGDSGPAERRQPPSYPPHRRSPEEPGRPDEQHDEDDRERGRQPQLGADEVDVDAEQVEADPRRSPPTTAPAGESMPPSTAAAKA